MAWTELTRPRHVRTGGGYASDTTPKESALIAPFLPAPKRVGRPRTTDLRDVFDAILDIATTGCPWRMLPNDFPPVSTVRRCFYDWRGSDNQARSISPGCPRASGGRAQGQPDSGGD